MRIHIVTSSKLLQYGGGVETWFSYFVPELSKSSEIFIYHVEKGLNDEKLIHLPCKCIATSPPKGLKLAAKTPKFLFKNLKNNDIILSIGSVPESIPGFICATSKRNISHIVWLRTIVYS